MGKIKVIVDSCADLTAEMLKQYDIDYVRMNTVHNGKETPASLTWEFYSAPDLYNLIRSGERVTTTQVPVEEFNRCFRNWLEQGYDIIYIACCSKQSGSVNTGAVVAKQLMDEFKGSKIIVIDSLNSSIGQGMLGMYATELIAQGLPIEEVARKVSDIRLNINEFATVHTLEHLRKAGRVKASSAFFGNLMGVKPILISDADGEQTAIKKVRGRQTSINEIVNLMAEAITDAENQTVYIAHADCSDEEIEATKQLIREKIHCRDIQTLYIGPIIGASVGPDTIGLWAYGKKVTYRAAEAK